MKLRYVFLALLLLLLIGGGGAIYVLYSSLDGLIEAQIEEQGAEILGTSVSVASVRVSPTTGEGSIRGFRVANPPGFPAGDAFTLDEVSFVLDLTTLTKSPIVVKSITTLAPSVNAVVNESGRTNLEILRENAERYSQQSASSGVSSTGGPAVLIRVDRVTSSGGTVAADLSAMGGKAVQTELSGMDLQKLGGNAGSPPGEIGSAIAVAFAKVVGKAVAKAGAQAGAGALIDKHLEGEAGAAAKELLKRFLK